MYLEQDNGDLTLNATLISGSDSCDLILFSINCDFSKVFCLTSSGGCGGAGLAADKELGGSEAKL